MATRGKITDLYDIEKIKAQQAEVVGYLDEFVRKVSNTKPIRVKLEGAEKTKDVVKGVTELGLAVQEYGKLANQAAVAQAKLAASESEHAKTLAATKAAQQQKNQATKEEIQLEQAAEGSIKQKQIQLKQLQRTYDELSAVQRNSSEGSALLKSIQALDKELKQLEGDTGRFQRNVGDYANAFANALTPLQGQLQKVRKDLNSGNFGGQQLASLQRQEVLLANVTEKLGQEFSSTRQQSRAFQEAVAQIGIEFGHQSKVFQEFNGHVGEGVDALNDIRDSIKLAASDTRQLDRLIGAATAVAGGFSIAQGAAALFGKENEDVQKALLKVQAVMAVLNGLQAIQNELKNKDSILRKVTGFLIKEETKALQSQVATQQVAAAATNETAVATDNAAKATSRWGLALKTIGIGILLSLIPLVSSAMSGLSKATTKVDKDLEGMGDTALEIADNAIKGLDDEIKSLNDSLGRTPTAIDKARKAITLLGQETVKILNERHTNKLKELWEEVGNLWENGEDRLSTIEKKGLEIRTKIKELEFLQKLKAADDFLKSEFEANKNAIKNRADLDKDANDRRLDELKKNFDKRKILEGEFLDRGKSLLRANLNDELKIIQANLDLQLSQSGGVQGKIREAEDNAHRDRILAERNFQDKVSALIEEAESRRRKLVSSTIQGIAEITGSGLSKMAQALEAITQDNMPEQIKQIKRWQEEFKSAKDSIVASLKDLRKEIALTALDTFRSFVSATFDRRKNEIQEEIDKLEEKKQKDIEVANSTIVNEQDKAAAIEVIEARAQSQREALERRQKQIDLQKAKFEKASAVLNVAIDTAQKVAAIKAQIALLVANPNPFVKALIPIAASQIPLVIAGGALATAAILAQPLPKFAKGTRNAPGGPSVVGDAKKKELVVEPSGDAYVTPATPTVMDIPKHSVVFPDADRVMKDLESVAMSNISKVLNFPLSEKSYGQLMTKAIENKLDTLTTVVANKHELHINPGFNSIMGIHKYGRRWNNYITEHTKF